MVSEHKTRSGIDSAVRSLRQSTSNHQNCWINSLLSLSSCPLHTSISLPKTSDNKPFLIRNRSSNFIKPSIDKDIKHSIDDLSTHEIPYKTVTVLDHNPPLANGQQQAQLLETQNAPGNLSIGNYTPYPNYNKNLSAPLKNKILTIKENFKMRKPVDQFVDDLVEEFKTNLPGSLIYVYRFNRSMNVDSYLLLSYAILEGNLSEWPEFISSFKSRVHNKVLLHNNMRMEQLISVLEGGISWFQWDLLRNTCKIPEERLC